MERRRPAKGKLEINRNKFTSNPPEIAANLSNRWTRRKRNGNGATTWPSGRPAGTCRIPSTHRNREKPVADVEIRQRAITVCHLANITGWVGRRLKWDPAKEQFVGDDEANSHLDRPRRKGFELPEIA